jgi:aminomethyltransferase
MSPLRNVYAAAGAQFAERLDTAVPLSIAGPETEYHYIRDAAGVTDFSFMQKFRVPEAHAIDFLDSLLAGNVAKTRYGRLLHTFLADDGGDLLSDCYVANNDEEYIVLCESIVDDTALDAVCRRAGSEQAGVQDLTSEYALIGVDGFRAWEIMKGMFGADIIGLPYLSIENYTFEDEKIRLFRAGKTSEFGYLLMAPASCAAELLSQCAQRAEKINGGLCGLSIHNDLRLEGRFFNIHAEGKNVGDPLQLGLQWMIDFDKGAFLGSEAILKRRAQGLTHKIIGVRAAPGVDGLTTGASIFHEGKAVAEIVADCFSHILDCRLGLAVFPCEIAYSGLTFSLGSPGGPAIQTISMPPIMPKSLTVKLDEM